MAWRYVNKLFYYQESIKRLTNIEKQETDGTFDKITKKERLFLTREKDKLKKVLEGVETMSVCPEQW